MKRLEDVDAFGVRTPDLGEVRPMSIRTLCDDRPPVAGLTKDPLLFASLYLVGW